jgi:hypothetical protein
MNNYDYIPDSVYTMCGDSPEDCTVCSNNIYSPVVNGNVHDSQTGKVFCPFGKGNTMNTSIYQDQQFLNLVNVDKYNNYFKTTWGHAPQIDPRPLTKIGLSWRTS